MTIKELIPFVTNKSAKRHFFISCPYFRMASYYIIIIISSWHFPLMFLLTFSFLVCITTFKGFHEISLQKRLCHGHTGHPCKWCTHPNFFFFKIGPNFRYAIQWNTTENRGARWLSGRVSDSGAGGPGFKTYRRRVVSLSKTLYSPKVLVNYPGSDGSVLTWLKNCWLGR